MSKIICDICGTSYAETAKQCPICGSVRPGDAQRVTNEVKKDGKGSTGYTHVKGGRFTKSNVKKRTKAQAGNGKTNHKSSQNDHNDEDAKANRGLVLMAIMLLLAIIGVVAYIAIRFFSDAVVPDTTTPTVNLGSDVDLSCSELTLDVYSITFDQTAVSKQLNVKTIPEVPSEPVEFSTSNPGVVTVSNKGLITPVGDGEAVITVKCGKVSKTCTVIVQLGVSPDATTPDATTPDGTVPGGTDNPTEKIHLLNTTFKLTFKGQRATLYTGGIPVGNITWSSSDPAVVTFVDGVVTAVANGTATVYAEYNGEKVSCTITCDFDSNSGVEGNGGVSEDGGGSSTATKTGVIANVQVDANVRSEPRIVNGANTNVVGTIALGTKVSITDEKVADGYTWYKIGENRWVASNYVKLD